MPKTTERRAGQRWKYASTGDELTLAKQFVDKYGAEAWEDTTGRRWFGWRWRSWFTLLFDAPAAAPQPAPAETTKCLFFGKGKLHGGEIHMRYWRNMHRDVCSTTVCDYHYLTEIEPKGGGSDVLHNDEIPERIERPKLAHSMGVEDPTLEDA